MQMSIDDQPAADTRPHGYIEHAFRAAAGAESSFGQRRNIAVVAKYCLSAQRFGAPPPKRKILPAGDLMALGDDAGSAVYRPAKANADSLDWMLLNQTGGRGLDLLQNSSGSPALIDIMPH